MASFCLAALFAGAAIAERPRPASCPEEVPTVTVTQTFSGASTVSDISTYTEPRDTWTRTLDAYNATVTITEAENPYTTTIYDPDTTYTSFIATEGVITTTCTETITTSQEATRTSYTGTYSSPLSPYCSTSTSYLYEYAQGTTTLHSIYTTWPPPSWATAYTPAGTQTLTSYAHDPTEHATTTVYSSGTETSTLSTSCTATAYTATAPAAAVTQAAQCAPKNLIANVEFVNYRDGTNRASWKTLRAGEPGGVRDASACCQACLDEGEGKCLLSEFSEGWACSLRIATDGEEEEGQCGGLAASVSRGESGWGEYLVMAPGCGRLEEDFY